MRDIRISVQTLTLKVVSDQARCLYLQRFKENIIHKRTRSSKRSGSEKKYTFEEERLLNKKDV